MNNRLKSAISDEVPHIFEAVFACTLEVKEDMV
mgnify:FL=1